MKKLLILLILTFTSCCNADNPRKTINSRKATYTERMHAVAEQLKEDRQLNFTKNYMFKVDFEGHSYIILDGHHSTYMIHDPDCQCKL